MTSTAYNREVKDGEAMSLLSTYTHLICHTDHLVSHFTPVMLVLFGSVKKNKKLAQ